MARSDWLQHKFNSSSQIVTSLLVYGGRGLPLQFSGQKENRIQNETANLKQKQNEN